jgi:serine/threonine-protein kinase
MISFRGKDPMPSPSESLPPGSIPVSPGDVLADKYRVDRVLGVGGMGVVVAATHLQLGQHVALKFMLPQALALAAYVERFLREARAAVRLKSDHVARVLDVGTLASGSPYMVMEYLDGSDLGAVVEQQGPLPVVAAVDYVLQACDAVAEAHSLGIVHRDLKPKNLFLTGRNDGRPLVKVLDFGISKHTADVPELSLTRTAEIIGSPNYMSPEQLRSTKAADARSDIWALGVILYELLTGRVPFLAESVTQLTAMVLTEPPPPVEQVRPDVPRALSLVITRCLEKDRSKRYASVAELAAALEPFAPSDTRDLAMRIGRIGSTHSLPIGQVTAPGTRIVVTGATSANWSGKTELASSRSKVIAVLASVVLAVALAAGIIAVVVVRSHRRDAIAARPEPSAASTPTGASTPSAAAASTSTPAASTSASAVATVTGSASVAFGSAPPSASASTVHGAAPPGPSTGHPGGRPVSTPPTAATGSASIDPPKYRTSW